MKFDSSNQKATPFTYFSGSFYIDTGANDFGPPTGSERRRLEMLSRFLCLENHLNNEIARIYSHWPQIRISVHGPRELRDFRRHRLQKRPQA